MERADTISSGKLGPRFARFNVALVIVGLVCVMGTLMLLPPVLDPALPGRTPLVPPHQRAEYLNWLSLNLEGLTPGSRDFDRKLKQLRPPGHRSYPPQGWFAYPNGRVVRMKGTEPDLEFTIPASVWEGDRAHLFERRGVTLMHPYPRRGPVAGVAVFYLPAPKMAWPWNFWIATGSAALLFLPLVALISWWRASKLEHPLRSLRESLQKLGPRNLDHRLRNTGELGHLGSAFNDMASRLESALQEIRSEKARAERAERCRREFLADVSHNLGTPLAAIQGWIGFLCDGMVTKPEEKAVLLTRISREIQHVSRTVHQLLQLSRWEDSEPELLESSFPLLEPLIEVAENLEEQAEEKAVVLHFQGLHHQLRVRGDRARVRELFQVFLENAIHHAGDGVQVTVSAVAEGERVLVTVRDDGCGIQADRLPKLKKRFQLAGGKGCGLGLAIADRLVTVHGGRLHIQSQPGRGTTIIFDLTRGS